MKVCYCIPSARPRDEAQGCLNEWRAMGYGTAVWRDIGSSTVDCDLLLQGHYPGYAKAVNRLVLEVLERYPSVQWCVTGGDDVYPDLNHGPEKIAEECMRHFRDFHYGHESHHAAEVGPLATFGVMQPTGDRFAGGSIDRIAGSPWMGRDFCLRMYGGNGPLFEGYEHMFEDEELKCVAEKLGVYWKRPDLVHLHRHFMRATEALDSPAISRQTPPHLMKWTTPGHWQRSQTLFNNRRQAGFPGHEPLRVEVPA